MPKYFQTYACGHSGAYTMSTRVKSKERMAILQKVFGKPCAECAGVSPSLGRENVVSLNQVYGLPALLGTENQIRWAEQIRLILFEQTMSHHDIADRLQMLRHTKMIVYADYWIKNRQLAVNKFLDNTEKLYKSLSIGSERRKKLTQIEREIREALVLEEFTVQATGVSDKYTVQCAGKVFGVYKFREEALQGISLLTKQLPALDLTGGGCCGWGD